MLFEWSSAVQVPIGCLVAQLEPLRRLDLRDTSLAPLAGLEPATCCLGDNCRYFVLYGPVRSGQVRLGRDSVESGLVRLSRAWWNDRENDHLSKQ